MVSVTLLKPSAKAALDAQISAILEDLVALEALITPIGEIEAMFVDYVPKSRAVASGNGVRINGGASATLISTVTISLDFASDAETIAGEISNKPVHPAGLAAAIETVTGGSVPVGSVIFFPGLQTPDGGYLLANGAAIARATYAALDSKMYVGDSANATAPAWYRTTSVSNPSTNRSITGNYIVLPDLRGVAWRFLDEGKGYDPDRAVNTYQSDAIVSHTHTTIGSQGGTGAEAIQSGFTGSPAVTGATGGTETRMKNFAGRGWVKY